MDSDDQESVYSEESVLSKSLAYDDNESSTCDSIITTFNRCNVKVENCEKRSLSSVNEEIEEIMSSVNKQIEEIAFTNDTVAEIPTVQISSVCHSNKTVESVAIPVSNDKEEPKTRNNSTNTENYRYKRKKFRQNNAYFKYRPYGYNHKYFNYKPNHYHHNNYYQRRFYNNYQQENFNYMNGYQYHTFCNNWDCEIKHRKNQYFRDMLFRGIFHFTKFLEYISHMHI